MITCESARIREFGRLINWGPLPSKPTPEAAPWANREGAQGPGGMEENS
jgi:hypothetical protein